MRGKDIPYNPMFFAYAIVNTDGNHTLYIDPSRINDALSKHLTGIKIRPYDTILADITQLSNSGKKIWVSPMSSYAVLNAVTNKDKLVNNKASPIRSLKSVKNNIEIATARECQVSIILYLEIISQKILYPLNRFVILLPVLSTCIGLKKKWRKVAIYLRFQLPTNLKKFKSRIK